MNDPINSINCMLRFDRDLGFASWCLFLNMKNFRGSMLALFLLLLAFDSGLFLLTSAENLAPQNKENCSYAVTIETTCTKGAETSNHVSLRFGDIKSNDILVRHLNSKHVKQVDPLQPEELDDLPRKPFQACTVDVFQVSGQCVESPICYFYLKLTGTDDWRPGFAQVRVLEGSTHLSSDYFYIRRYLPRHVWHGSDMCDKEVTPFGIKQSRKVFPKKPVGPLMP